MMVTMMCVFVCVTSHEYECALFFVVHRSMCYSMCRLLCCSLYSWYARDYRMKIKSIFLIYYIFFFFFSSIFFCFTTILSTVDSIWIVQMHLALDRLFLISHVWCWRPLTNISTDIFDRCIYFVWISQKWFCISDRPTNKKKTNVLRTICSLVWIIKCRNKSYP